MCDHARTRACGSIIRERICSHNWWSHLQKWGYYLKALKYSSQSIFRMIASLCCRDDSARHEARELWGASRAEICEMFWALWSSSHVRFLLLPKTLGGVSRWQSFETLEGTIVFTIRPPVTTAREITCWFCLLVCKVVCNWGWRGEAYPWPFGAATWSELRTIPQPKIESRMLHFMW